MRGGGEEIPSSPFSNLGAALDDKTSAPSQFHACIIDTTESKVNHPYG